MNRCSFCEWMPILPWPVWPLAGQFLLGQNVVVGSMMVLLALCGSRPRGVYLDPHFRYKWAAPRLSAELPPAPVKRDYRGFVLPVSEWRERISWAVPRSSAMPESADAHCSRGYHCGGLCVPEPVGEQHGASRD